MPRYAMPLAAADTLPITPRCRYFTIFAMSDICRRYFDDARRAAAIMAMILFAIVTLMRAPLRENITITTRYFSAADLPIISLCDATLMLPPALLKMPRAIQPPLR